MKYMVKSGLLLITVLTLFCSNVVLAQSFKEVGNARFKYLFWDVYDAKLATPSGQYTDSQHPVKLTLTYLRDISSADIIKATNEQWEQLDKGELVGQYDQQLQSLWPDINAGDSLTFITNQQGQGVFYFNDQELGSVIAPGFSDNFLAIWLSPNTSEPQMRMQLLGKQ